MTPSKFCWAWDRSAKNYRDERPITISSFQFCCTWDLSAIDYWDECSITISRFFNFVALERNQQSCSPSDAGAKMLHGRYLSHKSHLGARPSLEADSFDNTRTKNANQNIRTCIEENRYSASEKERRDFCTCSDGMIENILRCPVRVKTDTTAVVFKQVLRGDRLKGLLPPLLFSLVANGWLFGGSLPCWGARQKACHHGLSDFIELCGSASSWKSHAVYSSWRLWK